MAGKYELVRYFKDEGFKVGAEIGVAQGHFSEYLAKSIPGLTLYCVDPYVAHPSNYDIAKRKLDKISGAKVTFLKTTSMKALSLVDDNSLDFVFIDGDHSFDYVMEDIIGWSRKVKSGGIVSGHDFYNFRGSGVIEAVQAYTKIHNINYCLTGYDEATPDDKKPSFFWIKP